MFIILFDLGFIGFLLLIAVAVVFYGTVAVGAWFMEHLTIILTIAGILMAIKSIMAVALFHPSDRKVTLSELLAVPLDFIRGTIVVWFLVNMFVTLLRTFFIGAWFVVPLAVIMAVTVYVPLFYCSMLHTCFGELVSIGILLIWVVLLCKWPGNDFFYIGNEIFRYLSIIPEGMCLM
ncbi:MAG: hypothetical protein IKG46_11155 [Solobacterium sp.]|nr:hypothetical protein [Solobacterium sp.]